MLMKNDSTDSSTAGAEDLPGAGALAKPSPSVKASRLSNCSS